MENLVHILLALTPMERWSATRQGNVEPGSQYWLMVVAGTLLALLIILLIGVTYRRRQKEVPELQVVGGGERRPGFADNLARRGLSARENQILLAVALRSGVRRTQDIFASAEAFDQGVEKLLTESMGTRTTQEREQLNTELANLRRKLCLPAARTGGAAEAKRTSTRAIPMGGHLELMHPGEEGCVMAEVVRNDDLELALESRTPIESKPGDLWHVRSYFGMSVWEFDTSTVACVDGRLILNHSDSVHRVNRRRFPRVPINSPALIAHLPFMRSDLVLSEDLFLGATDAVALPSADDLRAGTPQFVQAAVTELAGPGLRIATTLPVEPGDMVVVVFALAESGQGDQHKPRRTIAAAGRVRNRRAEDPNPSIAVELTGLNDAETEELARATHEITYRLGITNLADAPVLVPVAT